MAGAVRMPELTGTDTRSSPYPSASHSVSQSVSCLLSVRLSVRLFDRSNPQSVCRLPGSLSQPARLSAPPVVSPLSVSRSANQSFAALLPKSSSCQSIVVCPSVLSAWFSVIRRIGPFRSVVCIPVSQSATRSICRTVFLSAVQCSGCLSAGRLVICRSVSSDGQSASSSISQSVCCQSLHQVAFQSDCLSAPPSVGQVNERTMDDEPTNRGMTGIAKYT